MMGVSRYKRAQVAGPGLQGIGAGGPAAWEIRSKRELGMGLKTHAVPSWMADNAQTQQRQALALMGRHAYSQGPETVLGLGWAKSGDSGAYVMPNWAAEWLVISSERRHVTLLLATNLNIA